MIPLATHTLRGACLAVACTAALAATGCGSSTVPAVTSNSTGSAPTATPTAAGQANTGGVADTPANPDRTYICAAAAMTGGQTIAYLTVAGSDNSGAQSECSTLAQGSSWTSVASSPFHENLYTPVCFVTFDTGRLTARVYTSDTGTFAEGVALCNPLLQQFALATLPPS